MGLFEDLATYAWNWVIFSKAIGTINACWIIGGWDLFWADDDGTAIERCFQQFGGAKVTFPYEYVFAGAPEGGI